MYEAWGKANKAGAGPQEEASGGTYRPPEAQTTADVPVGDLGSGSDYTVFLQHLGVPSTDIGSTGPYGVYHSAFDNFNWFKKFGDPDFTYEQEMARVYGLEVLRMADSDVLPYDYEEYGKEIAAYIDAAKKKAETKFGNRTPNFTTATEAARHFQEAGSKIADKQRKLRVNPTNLNQTLRKAERALLIPDGLPDRTWYRHAIYAPGRYTGYAAVVIPGVNEAIDKGNPEQTGQQIAVLAAALDRAAKVLNGYR